MQKEYKLGCSWCNRLIDENNNAIGSVIDVKKPEFTHGMCNECYKKEQDRLSNIELDYLQEPEKEIV